jgi:aryl-alcohol dehydrogenase-like predicted oxidoreductase
LKEPKLSIKSSVGFGGYRISAKSKSHRVALLHALNCGCDLIDTSTNYTDGDSEKLIGEVLNEHPQFTPVIISKVGYIQGSNIAVLEELVEKKSIETFTNISEHLKHSIAPSFIEDQIHRSLKRLQKDQLDIYLLHNPEYAFSEVKMSKKIYYERIKLAFEKMEELVTAGKIKYYGVSSNTFVIEPDSENYTSFTKLIQIANEIKPDHNFKYIQFPFNLIEVGAIQQHNYAPSLIEQAKEHNIITIANRPLNAFADSGLLRLADNHEAIKYSNETKAKEAFQLALVAIRSQWIQDEQDEKIDDLPIFKQICNLWNKQHSVDSIEQIFHGHLFPLISQIYGRDLSAAESTPYYDWFEQACWYAKYNMIQRAEVFHDQAVTTGLIDMGEKSLSNKAIDTYLSHGIDHILVGMRNINYVEDMKEYFNA